jgi:hypothetical protein
MSTRSLVYNGECRFWNKCEQPSVWPDQVNVHETFLCCINTRIALILNNQNTSQPYQLDAMANVLFEINVNNQMFDMIKWNKCEQPNVWHDQVIVHETFLCGKKNTIITLILNNRNTCKPHHLDIMANVLFEINVNHQITKHAYEYHKVTQYKFRTTTKHGAKWYPKKITLQEKIVNIFLLHSPSWTRHWV